MECLSKAALDIFVAFLKAGLIMFGGGHTVIPVLKHELVENRELLTEREFIDMMALTEGIPGPITIKAATFVGYRVAGIVGSLIAVIAVVLPTFVIALAVTTVLYRYYQHPLVAGLLRAVRTAALGLLLTAVLTFARGIFKDLSYTQTIGTVLLASATSILVGVFRVEPLIVIGLIATVGLVLGFLGLW